jgi:phosphohistidine phosphatase SixA
VTPAPAVDVAVVLLVRHARAGSKAAGRGDDRLRPLSGRGRRQAAALARVLRELRPGRILSSPLLRCLQTVAPLAERTGLTVEASDRLTPESQEAALELLREVGGPTPVAVCTHGEVIGDVLNQICAEDGLDLGRQPLWEKASTWVLTREGSRFTAGRYIPPPTRR